MALNCIEYPELQITGYDLTRFKATPLQLHSDTSAVALGVLNACLDPEDYLILQVDADTLKVAPTRFYKKENVTSNWMVLEALTIGGNFVLDLRQYNGIGTYSVNAIFNVNNLAPVPDYLNLHSFQPEVFDQLGVEAVVSALRGLPEQQRLVFNLHVVDGYSHAEIATMLQLKESHARTLLTRARTALQDIFRTQAFSAS